MAVGKIEMVKAFGFGTGLTECSVISGDVLIIITAGIITDLGLIIMIMDEAFTVAATLIVSTAVYDSRMTVKLNNTVKKLVVTPAHTRAEPTLALLLLMRRLERNLLLSQLPTEAEVVQAAGLAENKC